MNMTRCPYLVLFLVALAGSACSGQGFSMDQDKFVSPQAAALYDAAEHGDLDKARQLMANGASIDAMDADEQNLLKIAMRDGDRQAFENLLKLGADPTYRGEARNAAMHVAATLDDTWWLEQMLDSGASTECRDALGQTPLFRALGKGNGATELLLKAGADIHARDNHGRTVLIHASEINDFSDVVRFLDMGVDPEATDDLGYTFQYGFFQTSERLLNDDAKAARKKVRTWLREHHIPVEDKGN